MTELWMYRYVALRFLFNLIPTPCILLLASRMGGCVRACACVRGSQSSQRARSRCLWLTLS